jgi:hypothetical protein
MSFDGVDLEVRDYGSGRRGLLAEQRTIGPVRPSTASGGSGAAATTEVRTWPRNGIGRSRKSQLTLRPSALRATSWRWLGAIGWWTARLTRTAGHLTVIDSFTRDPGPHPRPSRAGRRDYLVADLFTWRPHRTYDVVLLSFWLSHVPRSRIFTFWALVWSCLAPGGRVFFTDNRNDPHPTGEIKDPYVVRCGPDLEQRRWHDGSKYEVVEVFYEPMELQSLLLHQGWTARLDATRWFIFGETCLAEGGAQAGPDASHNTQ